MSQGAADWGTMRQKTVAVPAHVVFRALAQETVLLDIRSGQYHGLDGIGARFFEAAREEPTLEAATVVLTAEFEQPVEVIQADLASFIDQLTQRGLVELVLPTG